MLTSHKCISTLIFLAAASTSSAETFREDFSEGLAPERWKVSTWTAPRDSSINRATFSANNVLVKDGLLRLTLSQRKNEDGSITSIGAEVMTKAEFGYGIYNLVMKASADEGGEAHSGTITGAGPYLLKSETEIDIEVEGNSPTVVVTSTWTNEDTFETQEVPMVGRWNPPHFSFHTYKIVWVPGSVQFFRDGSLIATHKKVVPSKAAPFLFNHWGTNDLKWGGLATPDVDRYVYIKSFSFTPLAEISTCGKCD